MRRIYLEYLSFLVLIVPIIMIWVYNQGTWQGSLVTSVFLLCTWLSTRSIQHEIDKEV